MNPFEEGRAIKAMKFRNSPANLRPYERAKQSQRILRAARSVFIRLGPSGFSGRSVAKEAALSLGSVQHAFPTIDSLLVAMIEQVITTYDATYEERLAQLPLNPRTRCDAIIEYLIADTFNQDTRKFFFGLWDLGCHNKLAATLLKEAYEYHQRRLATFIAAVRSDLDDQACQAIALQVASMIEGSMVYTHAGISSAAKQTIFKALRSGIQTLIGADQET
ncbi:MAG: TetR/AcrR family transcriptional regulator [Steroidobacteraceae bacterium]